MRRRLKLDGPKNIMAFCMTRGGTDSEEVHLINEGKDSGKMLYDCCQWRRNINMASIEVIEK